MGPCFGTILRQIRKNKKTKIVSIIDNIIPHEKRFGDRMFSNYFVKAVDAFVVMSRSVGEDMKQFVNKQAVRYIPHPIYDNYGPLIPKKEACSKIQIPFEQSYILSWCPQPPQVGTSESRHLGHLCYRAVASVTHER